MISIIAAVGRNGVIGADNRLPWRIPADLAHFKSLTMGHTVIMGRKTFESIGKPLPGRKNIVLTRGRNYVAEGCIVVASIQEALRAIGEEDAFVIGGSEVYRQFIPYVERMYITFIDEDFYGDAFFPDIDAGLWTLVSKKKGIKDDKNPFDYYFTIYERKS